MCRTRRLTANEIITQYRNENRNSNPPLTKSRMSNKELNVINIESADRSASRTNNEYNNTFDRIDNDDNEINIYNDEEIIIRSESKNKNTALEESNLEVKTDSKKNLIKMNEDDQFRDIEKRDLIDDFI